MEDFPHHTPRHDCSLGHVDNGEDKEGEEHAHAPYPPLHRPAANSENQGHMEHRECDEGDEKPQMLDGVEVYDELVRGARPVKDRFHCVGGWVCEGRLVSCVLRRRVNWWVPCVCARITICVCARVFVCIMNAMRETRNPRC